MLWQHDAAELERFITHMNTSSEHKFTTDQSTEEIAFLVTLVRIQESPLSTDLYTKPTESHNYLYYESAHPQRCKNSIPYCQFLRIRRICTSKMDFDKHVIHLASHFLRRRYPTGTWQGTKTEPPCYTPMNTQRRKMRMKRSFSSQHITHTITQSHN